MPILRSLFIAVLVLASACSGGTDYGNPPPPPPGPPPPPPPPPPAPGPTLAVTVSNNAFNPANGSVSSGGTVTWTWAAGAVTHNVTFDDGQGSSGDKSTGTHQRTFPTVSAATTFGYHCTIHAGMTGQVVVSP